MLCTTSLGQKNASEWFDMGSRSYDRGNYIEAIESFNRCIDLNESSSTFACYLKGMALAELGNFDEAIKAVDKSTELKPNDENTSVIKGQVYLNLGELYSNISMYYKALETFNRTTEINPKSYDAWYFKGITLHILGNFNKAIQAYDAAIDINPNDSNAWFQKGYALDDEGKYEEALKAYEEAIKIDPRNVQAWVGKAQVLEKTGRNLEGKEAFDKARMLGFNG